MNKMNIIPYKKFTLELNESIEIGKRIDSLNLGHRETMDKEDLKYIQHKGWILHGFQKHATTTEDPWAPMH